MTVRTTFALDVATETSIQRLAKLWKTSKAEVVRRSVAEAERAASSQSRPSPIEALQWLQKNGTLTEADAQKWSNASKRGWEEGWKRKAQTTAGPLKSRAAKRRVS
ncbi:MAG: hypothetical protein ACOYMN_08680 [Roseimicrobium sp.]